MAQQQDRDEYCVAQARRFDRDRFRACLLAPAGARRNLIALLAFNSELALTAEAVSEPTLGEIRLQWWRESLDGIYGESTRAHPVVEALANAIEMHALPRAELLAMIDARSADLHEEGFANMPALLTYAGATSGVLHRLLMRVLGGETPAWQSAAESVGTAWALIGLMRALPFHAPRSRLHLPRDELERVGVSPAVLVSGGFPPDAAAVVASVVGKAKARIAETRRMAPSPPRRLMAPLLPAAAAARLADRLEAAGHDPYRLGADAGPVITLPRLFWHYAFARL